MLKLKWNENSLNLNGSVAHGFTVRVRTQWRQSNGFMDSGQNATQFIEEKFRFATRCGGKVLYFTVLMKQILKFTTRKWDTPECSRLHKRTCWPFSLAVLKYRVGGMNGNRLGTSAGRSSRSSSLPRTIGSSMLQTERRQKEPDVKSLLREFGGWRDHERRRRKASRLRLASSSTHMTVMLESRSQTSSRFSLEPQPDVQRTTRSPGFQAQRGWGVGVLNQHVNKSAGSRFNPTKAVSATW